MEAFDTGPALDWLDMILPTKRPAKKSKQIIAGSSWSHLEPDLRVL